MNMPLVLLNRRRRGGPAAFSPTRLFALAEPGVWYDPSDLTTLFTDTAGTTPVTTPGQTVALALDKSKGLVLGPELVTNGDFSSGSTGWTLGTGWTIGGGVASYNGTDAPNAIYQTSAVLTSDKLYRVSITVSLTQGSLLVRPSYVSSTGQYQITSSGNYSILLFGQGGSFGLIAAFLGSRFIGTIDNISVRELPGFHATQATAASRPTYGIVPRTGRRNLLERTEEFDNTAWTKGNLITSGMANVAIAPDGTTTADKLIPDTASNTKFANGSPNYTALTGQAVTHSCYVKADGYSKIALRESAVTGAYAAFDLSTASLIETGNAGSIVVSNATITSVGSGWFRIAMTCTNASGSQVNRFGAWPLSPSYTTGQPQGQSWSGNGTSGILIWGAQLELGSTATAYQRVGSAFDVTEAGVASLSYLFFGGDTAPADPRWMVTPTITPGIDRAQVFAGVRKLSDAGSGTIIAEFSTTAANVGSFYLITNQNSGYGFGSNGTTLRTALTGTPAAPSTNVLTGIGDIAGDVSRLRVNGTQVAQDVNDQGTGNFLAYPLYIGRRGGTTLGFNGQLYSLIVRFGTNLDAGTITSTETWVAGKTGVTL